MPSSAYTINAAAAYLAAADSYRHSASGRGVTGVAATDLFTAAAHGLKHNDSVYFAGLTGGAGLIAGALYFVIQSGLADNTFRVSLTKGGAQVDITTDLTVGTISNHRINVADNDLAKTDATVAEAARYATQVANGA